MTAEHIRELESIGFVWEKRTSWDEQFEQLRELKAQ